MCLVLKANTDYNIHLEEDLAKDSIIYFGTIKKHNKYKQYKNTVINIKNEEYLNDLLSQIYINSKIAYAKFENYNKGIQYIFIGTFVLTIILILGYSIYIGI